MRENARYLALIDKLAEKQVLDREEYTELIDCCNPETSAYLFTRSRAVADRYYGKKVYIRGLIEFTNYCKNDCYYCGIRKSNRQASRYRLSEEEILACCETGYGLGFRTFVLQGGEDDAYTDERLEKLISRIKERFPDCALTLSLGERSEESYLRLYRAGADRYLLRHESADAAHYAALHPVSQSLAARKECLFSLKRIGYQVGAGFMVGSPGQTSAHLAEDFLFLKELEPHMIGIGPFIPHQDTPFHDQPAGSLEKTLFLLAMLRLSFPDVLLPATTALGTIHPQGREKGILAGANVVMPNLSPVDVRGKYTLYDNKICTGEEAAECRGCLDQRMRSIGYQIVVDRGDNPRIKREKEQAYG